MVSSNSIRAIVTRGVGSSFSCRIVQEVVTFTIGVFIARLLYPSDFGNVSIAILVLSALEIPAESSFHSAALFLGIEQPRQIGTVWWTQLTLSVVVFLLAMVSALPVAAFFDDSSLVEVIRIVSCSLLLNGLGSAARFEMKRRMFFSSIAVVECVSTIIAVTGAWIGAKNGWGVRALALSYVGRIALINLGSQLVTRWRPVVAYDRELASKIFKYVRSQMAYNVINFTSRSMDNVLIGKLSGTNSLGQYIRAQSLALTPMLRLFDVVHTTFFVTLVKFKGDPGKLGYLFFRFLSVLAFCLYPLFAFLAFFSGDIILSLYGHQWLACIPVLQVMAVLAMLQLVTTSIGWIFLSEGRTDVLLKMGGANAVAQGIGITIGAWVGGARSVALGYLAGACVTGGPYVRAALKIASLRPKMVVKMLLNATVTSLLAIGLGWSVSQLLQATKWAALGVGLAISIPAYVALSLIFQREMIADIRKTIDLIKGRAPLVPHTDAVVDESRRVG